VSSRRREIELSLPDCDLRLTTDAGVFSAERVDAGTRLLLQEAPRPTPQMQNLCDVGCGYGPIAVTLARRAPDAQVWAIDVNERAIGLCAENAGYNGVDTIRPVLVDADGTPVGGDPGSMAALPTVRFDGIWSNPPIRIGKSALHALLTTWLDRLSPEGHAWLVVQRHLGADSLADWMQQQGWATERLLSRAGYRLLEVSAR
jgi:16S rRNA (guanine1207-N2)-methyltransferase